MFLDLQVALVDTKMLLIENSRISLFNDLIRLSVFDYRSYILKPLKEYLLVGLKFGFRFPSDADRLSLVTYIMSDVSFSRR